MVRPPAFFAGAPPSFRVLYERVGVRTGRSVPQKQESPGSHPGLETGTGHCLSCFMIDLLRAVSSPIINVE